MQQAASSTITVLALRCRSILCLFVLSIACNVIATVSMAEQVRLLDGRLFLTVPDDFRAMTDEERRSLYPFGIPPEASFIQIEGKAALAVTHYPQAQTITPDQLPQVRATLETELPKRLPGGIKWISREIANQGGRSWIHLEFLSKGQDDSEHRNKVLVTTNGADLIFLNAHAQVQYWAEMASVLDSILSTIELNQ